MEQQQWLAITAFFVVNPVICNSSGWHDRYPSDHNQDIVNNDNIREYTASMEKILECKELDIVVAGNRLVRGLDFTLGSGQMSCLLGENGTGKTSTLHTMAGLLPITSGQVLVTGKVLDQWNRKDLACKLGLLMQDNEDAFPADVLETALIGRHPHLGWFSWESRQDIELAKNALAELGLGGLERRPIDTLSGGERRRLAIATLFIQDTEILLLDEPVNHLDPRHQLQILRQLRQLADQGKTVLASLHDINLARRFFDQALLLNGDGVWQSGAADDVLNAANLQRVFHTRFTTIPHGSDDYLVAG